MSGCHWGMWGGGGGEDDQLSRRQVVENKRMWKWQIYFSKAFKQTLFEEIHCPFLRMLGAYSFAFRSFLIWLLCLSGVTG